MTSEYWLWAKQTLSAVDWPWLIQILSALLTPLVALLALYIAYQQYKTNQNKLRLDLYDRRLELYSAFSDLYFSVVSSYSIVCGEKFGKPGGKEMSALQQLLHKTRFIFGKDIASYGKTVGKNATRLDHLNLVLRGHQQLPKGEERTKAAKEASELQKWFTDQYDVSREIFSRYLKF